MSKAKAASSPTSEQDLCARHMGIGWCALLIFLSMGLFLETLHGFKAGFYLDVSSEARRTMWTLSHAHGALISVVNIVFGISTKFLPAWPSASQTLASRCFIGALVLLPLGFFLGRLLHPRRRSRYWGVLGSAGWAVVHHRGISDGTRRPRPEQTRLARRSTRPSRPKGYSTVRLAFSTQQRVRIPEAKVAIDAHCPANQDDVANRGNVVRGDDQVVSPVCARTAVLDVYPVGAHDAGREFDNASAHCNFLPRKCTTAVEELSDRIAAIRFGDPRERLFGGRLRPPRARMRSGLVSGQRRARTLGGDMNLPRGSKPAKKFGPTCRYGSSASGCRLGPTRDPRP